MKQLIRPADPCQSEDISVTHTSDQTDENKIKIQSKYCVVGCKMDEYNFSFPKKWTYDHVFCKIFSDYATIYFSFGNYD